MIRMNPQQKQRAFALFFAARKRKELEDFDASEGTRLATGPEEVSLFAVDEEIWASHSELGAVLVGEVSESGTASIDVEICPNWDQHATPWWDSAHGAKNAPSLFRQLAESGPCQATEVEARAFEKWAATLSGWGVGPSLERTALCFRW